MRTLVTPKAARAVPAARRAACRATEEKKAKQAQRSAKDVRVGFKWNPGSSKWMKDDSLAGKVDAPVQIQPKSGAAYTIWPVMHTDLMDFGLESVAPAKAAELQNEGWTIVDVRVVNKYEKSHIEGSVSIPLFRPVEGDSMFDNIKRFTMGALAMQATEREPNFAANVIKELGQGGKIIVACDIGGTLKTTVESSSTGKEFSDPDRAFGRESRSLKAAHELVLAGCKNLKHLEGGVQQWQYDSLPMVKSDSQP